MNAVLFWFSLAIAVIAAVVAGRFLYQAWSDHHFGKNRRGGADRRRHDLPVPMERRRRQRRL